MKIIEMDNIDITIGINVAIGKVINPKIVPMIRYRDNKIPTIGKVHTTKTNNSK